MSPALYIDPENRLSRVPYKVPNNTHYVTLAQYQLMELQLKAEVERLTNCKSEADRLKTEVERSTAWGRGLESDLSHARVEISFLKAEAENSNRINTELLLLSNQQASEVRRLKAEVERLKADNEQLQNRCDFLEGKGK